MDDYMNFGHWVHSQCHMGQLLQCKIFSNRVVFLFTGDFALSYQVLSAFKPHHSHAMQYHFPSSNRKIYALTYAQQVSAPTTAFHYLAQSVMHRTTPYVPSLTPSRCPQSADDHNLN